MFKCLPFSEVLVVPKLYHVLEDTRSQTNRPRSILDREFGLFRKTSHPRKLKRPS